MNKVFEKILEKLEELQNNLLSQTEGNADLQVGIINGVMYSRKTVQEVAEEYNGGWIPCNELLPAYGQTVLASVCAEDAEWKIIIACYKEEDFWLDGKIDAWQPLPQPFQKGE